MKKFNIQYDNDRPDRVFVAVDNRFDVAIIRSEDGLRIQVFPIIDGEVWDDPFERFEVDENAIRELEAAHD
jgi:hypothetical protein